MFLPLGTDRPLRRPTLITFGLVAINIVAFAATATLDRIDQQRFAEVMARGQVWGHDFHAYTLITSAFLHGGLLHLLGNMLFLWVFGPNVEDKLGRIGFTLFYLAGAAISGGAHALFSDAPAIGASGAIAAVGGAYLVFFPRTQIKCLILFFVIGVYLIPAWWFILFQVFWDFLSQSLNRNSGVAHVAHLAGYGFGVAVSLPLLWLKVLAREPYDLFTIMRQAKRRRDLRDAAHEANRAIERQVAAEQDPRARARAEALAQARARVMSDLAQRRMDDAVRAYKRLLDEFGERGALLSRQRQIELGNHLFSRGDHQTAAIAYERFVEGYASDAEAPNIRLMIGLLCARYLNDPIRARRMIEDAMKAGLDQEHTEIADGLLEDLGVGRERA
ncbi:MAG: rhomboid family intramembrane serine protease [Phycisphaeraceae bacterium]|nr:rhomboid family intramembrane serine protease [Phycisphaeraceae bacterium]